MKYYLHAPSIVLIYQSKDISARTIIRHDLSVKIVSAHIHLLFVNELKQNGLFVDFLYLFKIICNFVSPVYPPATTSTSSYTTEDVTSSYTTTDNNILSTSTFSHTTENNIVSTSDVYTTVTTEGKYKISAALKVETNIVSQRVRYDELRWVYCA